MASFFNITNDTVAIILHVTNILMAICMNVRMRASKQDAIFPCRYKWKKLYIFEVTK